MPTLMLRESLISYDGTFPHYVVPEYIRTLAANAFYDKATLEHLTLPEHLDSIGDDCFRMCFNMKRIDMPKTAGSVGKGLFQQCWVLEHVELPEGTEKIGYDMFLSCHKLTDITIPSSVYIIDRNAFNSCKKLRYIHVSADQFNLIPSVSKPTAAITFMTDHDAAHGDARVEEYVATNSKHIVGLAIRRNEINAIHYMMDNNLIDGSSYGAHIQKANELHRTEIAALLLGGSKNHKKDDFMDWDPFDEL